MISTNIDEIDVKILRELLKDSRKKFSVIAKECGVSIITIRDHYRRMKEEGIIIGPTILPNPKSLGYECVASIFVNVDPKQAEQFMKDLRKYGARGVYFDRMKEYNIHFMKPLKNTSELCDLTSTLRQHPAVLNVKPTIWTEIKIIPENMI